MINIKINDIFLSLKYGRIYTGFIWGLLLFVGIVLNGLFIIYFVLNILFFCFNGFNLTDWFPYANIFVLILCGLLTLWYNIYVIKRQSNIRKRVNIWLPDMVKLKGKSKSIQVAEKPIIYGALAQNQYHVEIKFKYNSKTIKKTCGENEKRRNMYQHGWGKYLNREIDLLYSPTYDEVLILKEK